MYEIVQPAPSSFVEISGKNDMYASTNFIQTYIRSESKCQLQQIPFARFARSFNKYLSLFGVAYFCANEHNCHKSESSHVTRFKAVPDLLLAFIVRQLILVLNVQNGNCRGNSRSPKMCEMKLNPITRAALLYFFYLLFLFVLTERPGALKLRLIYNQLRVFVCFV